VIQCVVSSCSVLKEQRICANFYFTVGKTAPGTRKLCKAYGDESWSYMMAYEWFKHFKNGRASTDDDDAD
jgi:hypothetical protein